MDRRRFLATALTTLVTGCLTRIPGRTDRTETETAQSTTTPHVIEPTATLTYNGENDLTKTRATYAQRAVGTYYLAVCTSAEQANQFASRLTNREGQTFLKETDFDSTAVVVLQDAMGQSTPDLVVNEASLTGGAVILDVEYPGQGATSDIIQDMLFVRLAHAGRRVEHATVTIRDMSDAETTISTVGRYNRSVLTEPGDLVIRNRDCATYHVDVDATIDGELVYTNPLHRTYPAGTTVRHPDAFTHAGTYRITVANVGEDPTTTTLPLKTDTEPHSVLVDIDGDGEVSIRVASDAALSTDGTIECASTTLPYESSDPAENLAEPARITWVNRSPTTRTVTITVRDEGTTVLDRELTLDAESKGRTPGLIAKRGVYQTTIETEDATTRTIGWHVDEQSPDLQLLVEQSGILQIARASQR